MLIFNWMNFVRISITSMNKKSLKDIANVIYGGFDEVFSLPSHLKVTVVHCDS